MKSSSELFPVSLLKAEAFGELSEDVYLVKHNRDHDKSVEVAVSHLMLTERKATLGSIVLVHGSFTNRGFWISRKGEGLAKHLLEQGFDVWLMEHRGHGNSPRNQEYFHNTVERYVLHDLAAVNEFVQEKSGDVPFWLGHSLGGVMIASAIASGVLTAENCRGQILLGTQVQERPKYLFIPFVGTLLKFKVKRKGELSGRELKIGPENEPAGVIVEYLQRYRWFKGWRFYSTAQRLQPAWNTGTAVPLLAIAGMADKTDSAKACKKFAEQYGGPTSLLMLGKAHGFERNYGHVDMVVSKGAAQEVWPRISAWLKNISQ